MLEFNKPNISSALNEDGRHGIVTIEPLERGYGITLGNSIRRVLLSSVPGTAVVYVRIDGALHEFSSLNGVREDVTEIILNVKGIVAKLEGDEAVTGIIDVTGPAVVTDKDIKASSDLTLLNPDHVIATIGEGARFYMELTFEHGRGYVQSNINKETHPGLSADVIFVDSIFTPVYAVSYSVENTRVGAKTDYDKLTIDVTTNGVVDANEAVVYAGKILARHFDIVNDLSESIPDITLKPSDEEAMKKTLAVPIEDVQLSVRSFNCLKRAGVNTIEDLTNMTESEMMKIRNLGKKSFDEIRDLLREMELSFKPEE
jgi:DNA-directed RNA polymerase subunit alpha